MTPNGTPGRTVSPSFIDNMLKHRTRKRRLRVELLIIGILLAFSDVLGRPSVECSTFRVARDQPLEDMVTRRYLTLYRVALALKHRTGFSWSVITRKSISQRSQFIFVLICFRPQLSLMPKFFQTSGICRDVDGNKMVGNDAYIEGYPLLRGTSRFVKQISSNGTPLWQASEQSV